MSFKKLIEPLRDTLASQGFEEPLDFQEKVLSKIKGGASMFALAPKDSGKTTSIVLSVIQKLKGKALEDAPRVLVVVKDREAALALELVFSVFTKETDLRVYSAYEEKSIVDQKAEIYVGTDIVIVTPKRLNKLYFINGINLNKLQMFIIDDVEFLFGHSSFTDVTRIPQSIGKCQYLIFAEKFDKRFENWQDTFMSNAQIVKL